MSRSQNLRHNVINQVIDDMARGHLPSPLPSQSALAEMYNISRTTVRHMLNHLSECGVESHAQTASITPPAWARRPCRWSAYRAQDRSAGH